MKKTLLLCFYLLLHFQILGQCNFNISYSKNDYQCSGGASIGAVPMPLYGNITANVTNGIPPFQYKLNTGNFQSSNYFNNLNAGIYTLVVQDSTNCLDSTIITINQPPQPVISSINTTTPTSCLPGCDGTLSIQATGGTPPYQYAIAYTQFGPQLQIFNQFNLLCAGAYTVTLVDSNGCLNSTIALITNPNSITFSNAYITPSCAGGANGSINVSAFGGAGTINYLISPSSSISTNGQFYNLAAQTYTVTALDATNCMTTTTITVPISQGPSISVYNITNASCPYGCDGSAMLNSVQGLLYTISGPGSPVIGANGQIASLCANSSYIISASDANNCVSTTAFTVGVSSNITTPNITYIHHPSCAPGGDGYIVIPNIINTPFYNYDLQPSWPNMSQSNDTIKGMSSGTYTITVTDPFLGCYTYTTVTLNNQPVTVNTITPSGCIPCSGSVTLNSAINSTITIYPSANIVNNSLITNLCGGTTYTIMASDASNCTSSTTAYIANQFLQLSITSITLPTCIPGNNGAINVSGMGTNPINYSIVGNQIQQSNTTGNFTGLTAQQYTISATDANNCIQTTVYSLNYQSQSLSVLSTNNTCQNTCYGTAQVNGQGIISYTINGIGNPIINSNGMASNLCNSYYNIIGTDANGCTYSTTILISIASSPNILISNIKAPVCSYPNSGSFVLENYNSNPNVTYTISPPVNYTVNNDTIQGLSTGTYTITAVETNGCTKTQILLIPSSTSLILQTSLLSAPTCSVNCNGVVGFTSPTALPNMQVYRFPSFNSNVRLDSVELSIGVFQNLCEGWNYFRIEHNGCISNTISTNLPFDQSAIPEVSITYPCIDSANGSLKVLSPKLNTVYTLNTMPAGAQQISTGHFTNLSNANYILTAFDTLTNCSVSKNFNLTKASMLISNMSYYCNPNAFCNSLIILKPERFNLPLTYTFSPNTSITKLNDSMYTGFCKDSTYQILYTDSLGCSYSKSKIIYNYPFNSFVNKINPSCNSCNGSITTSTNSPFPPFTFQLSDSFSTWTNQSGYFNGLCKGNYTMNITDSMGFCSIQTFSLNPITIQKQIFIDSCFESCKAKAIFNPIGTLGAYTMSISPSIGTLSGNTFSNLCAGTYTLHVSDMSPCTLDTVFTIYQNTKVQLSTNTITPSVCGLPNGKIIFICSGGRSDYNYITQPGNLAGQSITNLVAQTYTCVVSDAYNCKDSLEVEIIDVKPVVIDSVATVPSSCYKKDGLIWIYPIKNFPYSFKGYSIDKINWQGINYFENVNHGIYTVYAKIHDGCIDSTTATVGFKNNLQLENLQFETEQCTGTNDGAILLPDNDFMYSIEPNFNVDHENRIIPNLPLGTYTLTASDASGCTGSKVVEILAAAPLTLQTKILNNTYGDCHGEVQIIAEGGTPPYTFQAEPSNFAVVSDSGKLNYLCNTDYSITVTDKHGCQQTQQIFIPYQDLDGDDFSIFPNPANNELNFLFSRVIDVVITLTDVSGRTIEQHILNDQTKISLPLTRYESGIYFVTLRFDDQQFIRKIQIQH
jgi:hypothetical protein